jgi:hypothetical protein
MFAHRRPVIRARSTWLFGGVPAPPAYRPPLHYAVLQRNLLYTGVTRGKRLVVLVGQKKAVAIAVRNVSGWRRWSKLAAWLSADPTKNYASA